MKKIIFALFVLSSSSIFAQKMKVVEDKADMAGARQNVVAVVIPEVERKSVEKEWCKLMKGYDAKISNKKEIFANNALIKTISDKPIDVYALVEETKEGIKLSVAINLGGAFLNSKVHASQYDAVVKIMDNFAKETLISVLDDKISDETKKLKSANNKQDDLVKSKDKLKSNIEKWKDNIKDAEQKIKDNDKDQETAKKEIEEQQKVVDALKIKQKGVK